MKECSCSCSSSLFVYSKPTLTQSILIESIKDADATDYSKIYLLKRTWPKLIWCNHFKVYNSFQMTIRCKFESFWSNPITLSSESYTETRFWKLVAKTTIKDQVWLWWPLAKTGHAPLMLFALWIIFYHN